MRSWRGRPPLYSELSPAAVIRNFNTWCYGRPDALIDPAYIQFFDILIEVGVSDQILADLRELAGTKYHLEQVAAGFLRALVYCRLAEPFERVAQRRVAQLCARLKPDPVLLTIIQSALLKTTEQAWNWQPPPGTSGALLTKDEVGSNGEISLFEP